MEYEAEIDLRNVNSSHALLVELVGADRRVLDVGCATGYLGRVLKDRGCVVSGVELDPEAAEAAEQVLDGVLVGDVDTLDLVGHFGKESFDVVVFGDVLEHLPDPAAVLRKVRPLLSDTGSVVASVPNVAHGSVRLALLEGRFDYRPLGLLDATHLRFFTRESLHALFREAGLVPVDVRRTTAGVFETEVQVRREDFDQGVVDAVEGDPESTTYQFVLRAVPEDSHEAISSPPAPPAPAARCRIGVWARWDPGDVHRALVVRVTCAELARRLPGAVVRPFSSGPEWVGSPHDGGLAVEPLGTWSEERAAALAGELDCAVVVGDVPGPAGTTTGAGDDADRFLLEGVGSGGETDCPVVWSAVRLPPEPPFDLARAAADRAYVALLDDGAHRPVAAAVDVPDPLVLVPRLLDAEALDRRLEFVRMMGWFPPGRAVVVEADAELLPHAEQVATALDELVSRSGASVVLVHVGPEDDDGARGADAVSQAMTSPVSRVPPDALVDDVVAVVAGAAAVAASSSSFATLGLAYERPTARVRLAADGASGADPAVVTRPGDLADLLDADRFHPPAGAVPALHARLDAHFDRVAAIADAAAAAHPRASARPPLLPPPEHVAALELSHRRMQERLDSERRAVADHLGRERAALRRAEAEVAAVRSRREDELERRVEAVTAELEALKNIRVLRALRPARALYARLRGGRL